MVVKSATSYIVLLAILASYMMAEVYGLEGTENLLYRVLDTGTDASSS